MRKQKYYLAIDDYEYCIIIDSLSNDRTTQSRKLDVVGWKNERDTSKGKRNRQYRNYLRIKQRRQRFLSVAFICKIVLSDVVLQS